MGFIGLSALLAARVLGPVAGVRVTFGRRAIAGREARRGDGRRRAPCADDDVIVDQKSRVYTTPGFLAEDRAPAPAVARGDRQAGARGGRVREGPIGGSACGAPRETTGQ